MTLLIFFFFKSCNNHHVPLFFWITKPGEFHGLVVRTIWPDYSSSYTSWCKCCSFSWGKGNWSPHTGWSIVWVRNMLLSSGPYDEFVPKMRPHCLRQSRPHKVAEGDSTTRFHSGSVTFRGLYWQKKIEISFGIERPPTPAGPLAAWVRGQWLCHGEKAETVKSAPLSSIPAISIILMSKSTFESGSIARKWFCPEYLWLPSEMKATVASNSWKTWGVNMGMNK